MDSLSHQGRYQLPQGAKFKIFEVGFNVNLFAKVDLNDRESLIFKVKASHQSTCPPEMFINICQNFMLADVTLQ